MKQVALLLSAGLAAALVTPRARIAPLDQALLPVDDLVNDIEHPSQSWWNAIVHGEGVQALEDSFERTLEDAELAITHMLNDDTNDHDHDHDGDHGHHGHHGHHGDHGRHGDLSKTIYELIKESKYTTRFATLVDEHDDIKELLQSTKTNRTLFVPTDRAFERIPPDHKKPPADFIRAFLAYSIAPGRFPSHRLFFKHTVPTELTPDDLGGHPQRIRVSARLVFGTRLNFFTKIIAEDIHAKNGLIHALDGILIPPPPTDTIIQLLPDTFSTFSLALVTTGLSEEIKEWDWTGGTAFVPTNRAFARLGPRVNAFLFSERGKKYLKALLQYSIVANQTLYSDAFYKGKVGDDSDSVAAETDYRHIDLPSMLHDEPISVDIRRWKGFVSIVANGYTRVAVQDVIGSDGVLQVVSSVLIPPRRHHEGQTEDEDQDREWDVDELRERLEPYLDASSEEEGMGDL